MGIWQKRKVNNSYVLTNIHIYEKKQWWHSLRHELHIRLIGFDKVIVSMVHNGILARTYMSTMNGKKTVHLIDRTKLKSDLFLSILNTYKHIIVVIMSICKCNVCRNLLHLFLLDKDAEIYTQYEFFSFCFLFS
jgi:hypothetical protein